MRTSFLYLCLVFVLLFVACKKQEADNFDDVRQAAEHYYGYLINGDAERYVEAIHNYPAMDEEYRAQLRDMIRQYIDDEQRTRGGIIAAHAVREIVVDSLQTHVFLDVLFGDSTCEQVSLPMVRTDEGWKMK